MPKEPRPECVSGYADALCVSGAVYDAVTSGRWLCIPPHSHFPVPVCVARGMAAHRDGERKDCLLLSIL